VPQRPGTKEIYLDPRTPLDRSSPRARPVHRRPRATPIFSSSLCSPELRRGLLGCAGPIWASIQPGPAGQRPVRRFRSGCSARSPGDRRRPVVSDRVVDPRNTSNTGDAPTHQDHACYSRLSWYRLHPGSLGGVDPRSTHTADTLPSEFSRVRHAGSVIAGCWAPSVSVGGFLTQPPLLRAGAAALSTCRGESPRLAARRRGDGHAPVLNYPEVRSPR